MAVSNNMQGLLLSKGSHYCLPSGISLQTVTDKGSEVGIMVDLQAQL